MSRVEMLAQAFSELRPLCAARGRPERARPSALTARQQAVFPSPKAAPLWDDHSGFELCPLVRVGDDAPVTGSSAGATRQAEIDQHSQELAMRRMSDTSRLSD